MYAGEQFVASLQVVKEKVAFWDGERYNNWDKTLKEIEYDLKEMIVMDLSGEFSSE